ncbi:hypothetical protein [Streptomyces poriticola]|uniref:hypothetical protein n=1 Tax=Streptomyces poriticola TaxID=3120506 RepID=UPI002FCE6823
MNTALKRLAACLSTSAALLAATAATATAQPQAPDGAPVAVAAACYDTGRAYIKHTEYYTYPLNQTPLTTTGYCNDINLRPNTNRYVRVCFTGHGCQSGYTLARAGTWNTIATDVISGSRYYFQFRSAAKSTGYYAA